MIGTEWWLATISNWMDELDIVGIGIWICQMWRLVHGLFVDSYSMIDALNSFIGWNRIGCKRGYPKRENRREIRHAKEWFRRLVHPSLYDVRNMFESSPKWWMDLLVPSPPTQKRHPSCFFNSASVTGQQSSCNILLRLGTFIVRQSVNVDLLLNMHWISFTISPNSAAATLTWGNACLDWNSPFACVMQLHGICICYQCEQDVAVDTWSMHMMCLLNGRTWWKVWSMPSFRLSSKMTEAKWPTAHSASWSCSESASWKTSMVLVN